MMEKDLKDFFTALAEASEDLAFLSRHSILVEIGTGMEDACGGYGWRDTITIAIKKVGERCMYCDYDDTLPYKELDEIEHRIHEDSMRRGIQHRHRYAHTERTIALWSNSRKRASLSIQDFVKQTKELVKRNYIRPVLSRKKQ